MTDLTMAVLRQKGWSLNDRPELFSYSTIPAYTAMSVRRGAPMKKFWMLALLREAFDTGSLSVVWAETTAQLADTMTKADGMADARLLATLSDGFLRYSYETCSFKIPPQFSILNTAKAGVVEDSCHVRHFAIFSNYPRIEWSGHKQRYCG
jgi:hypothetical protein